MENLIQWAKDEAKLESDWALDYFENNGRDDYHAWLIKTRGTLHNLFEDENLITVFINEFNKLTSETTNLYL